MDLGKRGMVGVFLLAAWLGPGCDGPEEAKPPNVLVYVVDTLRADGLRCYGNDVVDTPSIDALADEGMLFENAYAQSSWTRPSMASLLTGLNPGVHGAEGRDDPLALGPRLLSEILQDHGYATCLVTANPNIGSFFGFDQGFDEVDELYARDEPGNVSVKELIATSATVGARVIDWIEHAPEPFCMVVLVTDPHSPYEPPVEFDRYGRGLDSKALGTARWINRDDLSSADQDRIRALYLAEIAFTDHELGKVLHHLRARGQLDRTLTIFTSDHGEEFWEHGDRGHGRSLHEEVIRVPLIVRYTPFLPEGSRVDRSVQLVDVLPTVLDFVGIDRPSELDGKGLFADAAPPAFSSLRHEGRNQLALVKDGWKLIVDLEGETKQLFDLGRASGDLATEFPERAASMMADLEQVIAHNASRAEALLGAEARDRVDPEDVPEDVKSALKKLGYLGDE